ncbi:hypothetical protein OEZ49_11740, partial [Ruegeria sp. WL0004]
IGRDELAEGTADADSHCGGARHGALLVWLCIQDNQNRTQNKGPHTVQRLRLLTLPVLDILHDQPVRQREQRDQHGIGMLQERNQEGQKRIRNRGTVYGILRALQNCPNPLHSLCFGALLCCCELGEKDFPPFAAKPL